MTCVLDASVVVKWLFSDPDSEPLTDAATALIERVVAEDCVLQPVHLLAEVGGVLARKTPDTIATTLGLLDSMQWDTADDIDILQRAGRLAVQLNHHLFDTLYHAVALETDGMLITADMRYLAKAHKLGHIAALKDWRQVLD